MTNSMPEDKIYHVDKGDFVKHQFHFTVSVKESSWTAIQLCTYCGCSTFSVELKDTLRLVQSFYSTEEGQCLEAKVDI